MCGCRPASLGWLHLAPTAPLFEHGLGSKLACQHRAGQVGGNLCVPTHSLATLLAVESEGKRMAPRHHTMAWRSSAFARTRRLSTFTPAAFTSTSMPPRSAQLWTPRQVGRGEDFQKERGRAGCRPCDVQRAHREERLQVLWSGDIAAHALEARQGPAAINQLVGPRRQYSRIGRPTWMVPAPVAGTASAATGTRAAANTV